MVRVVGIGDPQDPHPAVQELARAFDDRVQDLVHRQSVHDPALKLGQALEQHLALA